MQMRFGPLTERQSIIQLARSEIPNFSGPLTCILANKTLYAGHLPEIRPFSLSNSPFQIPCQKVCKNLINI